MTSLKVSEISPTTLRLPPRLRATLQREATIRGSSLSQEIVRRLVDSLPEQTAALVTGEARPAGSPAPALGESQRMLLRLFSELPPEQQLALLTFLRR